jgi:hypothetical protein
MRKFLLLVLSLAALAPGAVTAWGPTAHRLIARAAVRQLPPEVPRFLAADIDWIGARAIVPDSWRAASEPFVKMEEDPNHVWYMERFDFLRTIPRSRTEFLLALYDEHKRLLGTDAAAARLMNVANAGTLPYQVAEIEERLKIAFREWRGLRAAGGDTRFIERDAAFYVGWLAHYAADGAMPLHTSIHHDGWIGENPQNYTRDGSIHWRFENDFVDLTGLSEADLESGMAAPVRIPDVFNGVLAHLTRAHLRLEEVYALDLRGALRDRNNGDARALMLTCTREATTLLRDLVYTAWLDSSAPGVPIPPPPGFVQPSDPRHPLYNPATGSAPAPLPPR